MFKKLLEKKSARYSKEFDALEKRQAELQDCFYRIKYEILEILESVKQISDFDERMEKTREAVEKLDDLGECDTLIKNISIDISKCKVKKMFVSALMGRH